jgi:co-chaperonin GroES (HSP10)
MQIKPAHHRILVKFYFPDESEGIVLPESNLSPSVEDKRTLVECLEIGPDVTVCDKGDFLLLHVDTLRTAVPIHKDEHTALIHDSMVIAIVLDDAQHVR